MNSKNTSPEIGLPTPQDEPQNSPDSQSSGSRTAHLFGEPNPGLIDEWLRQEAEKLGKGETKYYLTPSPWYDLIRKQLQDSPESTASLKPSE